jgi:hypothetical protein
MAIKYQGTYDRDELLRLDGALRKAFGLSGLPANLGCFGLAAVVGLALAAAAIYRGDESAALQWFLIGGTGAVFAVRQFWSLRRLVTKNPRFGQTVSGTFRDDGFDVTTPTSETRIAWAGLSFAHFSPDHLLLVGRSNEIFGFSATFFASAPEFAAACALARDHVTGTSPGRSPRKLVASIITWIVVIIAIILLWSLFKQTQAPTGR